MSHDWTIAKVDGTPGDHVFITSTEGSCSGFQWPRDVPLPKPGQTITRHTDNGGEWGVTTGADVDGVRVYLKTPREVELERLLWLERHEREMRERWERERPKVEERIAALPAPYRARIDRLRAGRPDDEHQWLAYEMAAVGDAPKIEAALRPFVEAGDAPDVVAKRFHDLPFAEQNRMAPGLDQGHSGNTFGAAVAMARAVLNGEVI